MVKTAVFERHVQDVTLAKFNSAGEAAASRQFPRDVDKFLGQIDTRDAAISIAGDNTRRPADAASQIKNFHARFDPGMFDVFPRCRYPPSMHLIAAKQVIKGHMIRIEVGPAGEKFNNTLKQTAVGVMTLYPIRYARHAYPLKLVFVYRRLLAILGSRVKTGNTTAEQ